MSTKPRPAPGWWPVFFALALLYGALVATAAESPVVGLVDEPQFHPARVAVEVTARGPAGVKVTAADGTLWWLRWLDRGQDVALVMLPVRPAEPGTVTWQGVRPDGFHRIAFRVAWPGACPCRVDVTSEGKPALTWKDVSP